MDRLSDEITWTSIASFLWNSCMERLSGGVLWDTRGKMSTNDPEITVLMYITMGWTPFGKQEVLKGVRQLRPHCVKFA